MVLFPAIGLLLWIAFLLACAVLCSVIWVLGRVVLFFMDLKVWHDRRRTPVASKARASAPQSPQVPRRPEAQPSPEIWPKWNAAHRRYVDRDLSAWQEQFDALNWRKL